MARKSNKQLLKERLRAISSCPECVLSLMDEEELFPLIQNGQSGDAASLCKLVSAICRSDTPTIFADALDFFGELCLKAECKEALLSITDYAFKNYLCLDTAVSAAEFLTKNCSEQEKCQIASRLSLLTTLSAIDKVHPGVSKEALSAQLDRLPAELSAERYFLLSAIKETEGKALPPLDKVEAAQNQITKIIKAYPFISWREFWLRIAYEMCEKEYNGDFSVIVSEAVKLSLDRKYCKNANLYSLSWLLYAKDKGILVKDSERLISSLLRNCCFDGTPLDPCDTEEISRLMRLSIYERDDLCRVSLESERALGNRIVHEKNRYTLFANLVGHSKRAKSHYWEITVSIPRSNEKHFPVFSDLKVDKVNHSVTRFGIETDSDPKKTCQILCSSEIKLDDVRHPFTLDFIADVAYVCAVKCQKVEVKIKSQSIINGHYVMTWGLFFI